ncbi:basic salivary proline-rich protein 4-like [Hippopotamus amphibius kiboko]|uniref:basic salivary proline-rich protein 4-like n=1 Tax=Hippopotamus amphibius kiboko TaxID=575201 RepID=UPI002592CE9B|nr:basic salivary proline-rich protein 4-like [Hippopotamus amphibius kiboko]
MFTTGGNPLSKSQSCHSASVQPRPGAVKRAPRTLARPTKRMEKNIESRAQTPGMYSGDWEHLHLDVNPSVSREQGSGSCASFLPCDFLLPFSDAHKYEFIVGKRREPRLTGLAGQGPPAACPGPRPRRGRAAARHPEPPPRPPRGPGPPRRGSAARRHRPPPGEGGRPRRGGRGAWGYARGLPGPPGRPTRAAGLTWAPWAAEGSGPSDRWVPPPRALRPRGLVPSPRARRGLRGSESSLGRRESRARRLSVALQVPGGAPRWPPPASPRGDPTPARCPRGRLCAFTPSRDSGEAAMYIDTQAACGEAHLTRNELRPVDSHMGLQFYPSSCASTL